MINITFGTVLVCALTAAWMLGKADRKPVICKGVSITITDSTTNQFISILSAQSQENPIHLLSTVVRKMKLFFKS